MCGPECVCWKELCGDCCVHEYCKTHDNCCSKFDYWSQFRCYVPLSFSSCAEAFSC
jgi:hypothetical protein